MRPRDQNKEHCPRDLSGIYTLKSRLTISANTHTHTRVYTVPTQCKHALSPYGSVRCKWLSRQRCSACAHTEACLSALASTPTSIPLARKPLPLHGGRRIAVSTPVLSDGRRLFSRLIYLHVGSFRFPSAACLTRHTEHRGCCCCFFFFFDERVPACVC